MDKCRKSKSPFKGHNQPRVPTELGYYDLRLPIVREQQADMARDAGVTALGYSIKSRGITKDLRLQDETIVNCKSMSKSNDFLTALKYVIDHRDELESLLDENIPVYKRRLYEMWETNCNQLNNIE